MLGVVVAVAALVPVACPWATYPLPKGADMRLGDPSFFHGPDLLGLAFSPDGSKIATANSRSVVVRCAVTGRRLAGFDYPTDEGPVVTPRLAFSPDGRRLIAAHARSGVLLFDLPTRRSVALPVSGYALHPHFRTDGSPAVIAFRPASGVHRAASQELLTFDPTTGEPRETAPLDRAPARVGAGGTAAAVVRGDKWVRWDLSTGKAVGEVPFPPGAWGGESDASANRAVFWHASKGTVWVLDPTAGRVPFEFTMPDDFRAPAVGDQKQPFSPTFALSPDGTELAAARDGGWDNYATVVVRRWRIADGKELPRLNRHVVVRNLRLAYSPDGKTIAATGRDGEILLWDRSTGATRRDAPALRHVATGHGRWLQAFGDGEVVRVHDAETGRLARVVPWRKGPRFELSEDGELAAANDGTGRVSVHDLTTGKEVLSVPLPAEVKRSQAAFPAFSRDGTRVLVRHCIGVYKYATDCWRLATGEREWFAPETRYPYPSPDGAVLYAEPEARSDQPLNLTAHSTDGGTVRWIAELSTRLRVNEYSGCETVVSPDGERVAVNLGGGLEVFDTSGFSRRSIRIFPRAANADDEERRMWFLRGPVFAPDGGRVAVAYDWTGGDGPAGAVEVWELATGSRILSMRQSKGASPRPLAISPSGRYLWTNEPNNFPLRFDLKPPKSVCFDRVRMWAELGSPDAGVAYAAAGRAIDGTQWAEMGKRFPPERAAEAKAVNELLTKLASREFKEREAASAELVKLGSGVLPALREVLKNPPSAEVRVRAEKALRALTDETSPLVLARARLVSAVAMAATDDPAAREQLRAWAKGDAGLPLTDAARTALARLPK